MKYVKLFEEYNSQTANLQKVKITSGEIELIGHIVEKELDDLAYDSGLVSAFFIPEKDGFIWNSNFRNQPWPNTKPEWVKRSEEFFNKNIGKKLAIISDSRYNSFSFGKKNKNVAIHIPELLIGDDVTFEFI